MKIFYVNQCLGCGATVTPEQYMFCDTCDTSDDPAVSQRILDNLDAIKDQVSARRAVQAIIGKKSPKKEK